MIKEEKIKENRKRVLKLKCNAVGQLPLKNYEN